MRAFPVPVLACALAFLLVPSAVWSIPDGLVLNFPGGSAGPVTFDGTLHSKKGFSCDVCHTSGLFQTKKGGDKMGMELMKSGKFCGHCHDGKKAFSMGDKAKCKLCHRKK